ncbi:MAG: Holliday junction branch migration DNA helicase RuvB [Planctomycetes bacterium]|jgi:Holliday junction DNA helicase RuvB|nr:Holliday junction branch migration DNA helicase RuvB [Planctomycetota bacterium]MCP4838590.1 Holliday junction branch migration DNA helicase RuvB [Planctomycetota bacterium]
MTRSRIISASEQPDDVQDAAVAIRPKRLDDFVGQQQLQERLSIAMTASRERVDPMEHLLLHGPPGLGKTTIAHIVAEEMGSQAYVTSGPALTKGADLVGTLTRMQPGDVLFIDEIHRLPAAVEEYIYPAMEDFKIDFTLDGGMHARVVTYHLKPFTLIGATTRAGLLTAALRSRFGIAHRLDFYEVSDLEQILDRAASRLKIDLTCSKARGLIAARSRGTPRICLRLLRRVRDYAQVRGSGNITIDLAEEALRLEGVDERGLDPLDRAYLSVLADVYNGGPAGLEAIAATLGEDSGTLEDLVEPFLLQQGMLARTRQGRQLTPAGVAQTGSTGGSRSLFADPESEPK